MTSFFIFVILNVYIHAFSSCKVINNADLCAAITIIYQLSCMVYSLMMSQMC